MVMFWQHGKNNVTALCPLNFTLSFSAISLSTKFMTKLGMK